jgi:hypothetical protein
MPTELNTAIEASSFACGQSKSAFIREAVERYLQEVNYAGLDDKESAGRETLSCTPGKFRQLPWRLFVVWFIVSLAVTSASLYFLHDFRAWQL